MLPTLLISKVELATLLLLLIKRKNKELLNKPLDFTVHGDPADQEIADRCNPQCQLNQEPGYVIYSAVGSFYAPMLVMMFFNWRIYRTATKTTKAIRQGWTKVKGVSGDEEGGLGIHRGGGASSYLKSGKPNGSSTRSGGSSSRRTSSRRPSNAFIGNFFFKPI